MSNQAKGALAQLVATDSSSPRSGKRPYLRLSIRFLVLAGVQYRWVAEVWRYCFLIFLLFDCTRSEDDD